MLLETVASPVEEISSAPVHFHQIFGSFDFVGRVAVNGEQHAALAQTAFITLGFIFGNAQADQRSGNSADG